MTKRPKTLGELRASGWQSRSVRQELRENLERRLAAGEPAFPGIIGYEDTVLPQLEAALLAEHSVLLLGLRGQAKSRLVRGLPSLLDDWIPAVEGSDIHDDPLAPIGAFAQRRIAAEGDATPIRWVGRDERLVEKLATPDVTVADLIGDVDPIKAASKGLEFGDPEVIQFGLLPRANRGLFAIHELPDLSARIQVALLGILEEGEVQVRGFPIRMPLDVGLFFTANPEDYTNRGSIITPLRDRIESQILTHYPATRAEALAITDQEALRARGPVRVFVPDWLRSAIEQVAFEARDSELVDQRSGVSARLSIALREAVVASAQRRGLRQGIEVVVARCADLYGARAAVSGKLELVYDGEREGLASVTQHLLGRALKTLFDELLPDAYGAADGAAETYDEVVHWFGAGNALALDDDLEGPTLLERLRTVPGLETLTKAHLPKACAIEGEPSDAALASAAEFVLEGLAMSSLLARQVHGRGSRYRDMLGEMAESLEG